MSTPEVQTRPHAGPHVKPLIAVAVLSMLHETAGRNSATQLFRGKPVLGWTLQRLGRADRVNRVVVLCWEDQSAAVAPVAGERGAYVLAKGPRTLLANVDAVAASRAWADGWRGGLIGACDFDLGFYAPWTLELLDTFEGDVAVLVDPSAGLVDPFLIDRLIEQSAKRTHVDLHFTQANPGHCGAVLRRSAIERFAATRTHPGVALTYLPDHAVRDPIGGDGCMAIPTTLTRATRSFKLNSDRQIDRLTSAAHGLNGSLVVTDAEGMAENFDWPRAPDALPRDVTLELTTRRESSPIYWPGRHLPIHRPDLGMDVAENLFTEIGRMDDMRLTLAGVGDPLLHPQLLEIIRLAMRHGVRSIHLETDLLCADAATAAALATAGLDVVSVHLPALTPQTYTAVMGVNGYAKAIANITALARARVSAGRLTPLIAPTFAKCKENLAELESWYDGWLKAVGSAVVVGPSDFAGQIPGVALADMSPPRRSACVRLESRCTILSDGTVVSCEQDAAGLHPIGRLPDRSLSEIWTGQFQALRVLHACRKWGEHALCSGCSEWHRT